MLSKSRLIFFSLGALCVAVAILLGAYGAHGLAETFLESPRKEKSWGNAVDYQMFHGLALCGVSYLCNERGTPWLIFVSGWMMVVACILFFLSIYAWVLGGPFFLVKVTPWGGILFVTAWVCLAIYGWGNKVKFSKKFKGNE